MNISNKGLFELASYEAMSTKKYLDSGGVQTIGLGSTISDIPDLKSWDWDKELSIPEVVAIYLRSLLKYVKGVNEALKVSITQEKFDAIISLTYNIGVGAMKRSTFMRLINDKASDDSICKAIKMFNKDNGVVVKGLINRRNKESDLYKNNIYSNPLGRVLHFPIDTHTHKPMYKIGKMISLGDYLS